MFPPRTPGDIEAEILMARQVHKGSFLVLEGQDNSKFWRGRIAKEMCYIVVADGKSNVIGAIKKLDARRFLGALGIVDDDFDGPNGCQYFDKFNSCQYRSANLIGTDANDLECLLLRSPALDSVLGELGDSAKIKQFEQRSGLSVRDGLWNNGLAFGRLRWLAIKQGWRLSIDKQLSPGRFIERDTWLVKEAEMLEAVAQAVALNANEVRVLLDALPSADSWYVCQGHDLTEILRLGLQKALGNLKTTHTKDDIASSLRLAFHDIHLVATQLYADIQNWERLNIPYRILPS